MPKPQLFGPFLQERLTTAYATAIVSDSGTRQNNCRLCGGRLIRRSLAKAGRRRRVPA